MKNKKLLVGLLSASGIAITLPAIASCSKNNVNEPTVSEETPKEREVGAKATRTYFLIKQANINNPEETKVKMVNLMVNGAEAKPVDGLIKSHKDSAGNILVVFNMSIAQKQYQADTITFDLKLTNVKANTEYTVTGFSVSITDTASTVTYNTTSAPGITWIQQPDSVGEGESLFITFTLEKGYEWLEDECDITIDGTPYKETLIKLQDETGGDYWRLYPEGAACLIQVPAEFISPNSDIEVTLKTKGLTYKTSIAKGQNFTWDKTKIGENMATHGTDYKIAITPNDYYTISTSDITVTCDGQSLTGGTDYNYDSGTLTINGGVILGPIVMTVTPQLATYTGTIVKDAGFDSVIPSGTPTYTKNLTVTYSLKAGKVLKETTADLYCTVTNPKTSTITDTLTDGDGMTLNKDKSTVVIDGSRIKGNLEFHIASEDQTFTCTLGTTHKGISSLGTTTPTTPTYHQALTIPFNIDTTNGYVFSAEDFDVPASGKDPNIKIAMGSTTLVKGTHFTVDTNSVTINADVLEDNIVISGAVTHYTTTVSQTGFTAVSQVINYKAGEQISISATMEDGYVSASAVIECGEETFTEGDDYTITTSGQNVTVELTEEGAEKVTAPLSISLTAVKELKITGSHQMEATVGTELTLTSNVDATWTTTTPSLVSVTSSNGKTATVKVLDGGSSGGTATVKCTPTDTSIAAQTFDIELFYLSKINYEIQESTWEDWVKVWSKGDETDGKVIIPGKIYDDNKSQWDHTCIVGGGFTETGVITELILDEGITTIQDNAFKNNTNLQITTLHIPSTLKDIQGSAFQADSSEATTLQTVTFADNATYSSVYNYTFRYQTSLQSIKLPDSVKSIGYGAFTDCTSLTEINIPSQCATIYTQYGQPFEGCTALKTVVIDNSTIANGTTNYWDYAETVYVKDTITVSSGFLTSGWTLGTSTRTGYNVYTKNA